MKNLIKQPVLLISLAALALLAPASQFAAETLSGDALKSETLIINADAKNSVEPRNLMVVAQTHEQGVALRRMLDDQDMSSQLDDLAAGFTIECSERFDNKCKVFGKN